MKKVFYLLTLFSLTLASCSGDEGPQGPEGPPGEALLGTVFEETIDLNAANDYSEILVYEDFTDVEVFETDVVLVYLMVGTDGEAGGEPVPVWRLLPQTYYVDGGTMQYNYDYTFFSVNIFLDADVELSSLDPVFTEDQTFRIAILPAEFAETTGVDVADYYEVMNALKIQESDIPVLDLK